MAMSSPLTVRADGFDPEMLRERVTALLRERRRNAPDYDALPAFDDGPSDSSRSENDMWQLLASMAGTERGDKVSPNVRLRLVKRAIQRVLRVYTSTQSSFNHSTREFCIRLIQDFAEVRGAIERVLGRLDLRSLRASPREKFDYPKFLARYYGDVETLANKHSPLVRYFEGRQHVLDLGCGSGAFLLACKRAHVCAQGVDLHPDHEIAARYGLDIKREDVLGYLRQADDRRFDGVFCSQLIEHLYPDEVIELFALLARKMACDAALVIEVPNVRNLGVLARNFYSDPTHVRPYTIELLSFLGEEAGFPPPEVITSSPMDPELRLAALPVPVDAPEWITVLNRNLERLNTLLVGDQDVALIFRRTGS